jgi:NOL1/NOP2/fmu family ribosome biogenesis protein
LHQAKGYRFFPDKLKGEGFFIAAFKQVNNVHSPRQKEAQVAIASAKEREQLTTSIHIASNISIFKHNDIFNLFPQPFLHDLKILTSQLYIRQAGIATGSFKGRSFVPEHALAVSNIKTNFNAMELSKDEALSYLRKQDIKIDGAQGWCRITYKGLGLGWIKNLPNRTNNYYPSEWRILKN